MAQSKCICSKCGKTIAESSFYKQRDGKRSDLCKKCETLHLNAFNIDDFALLLFKKYDIPYIPPEWDVIRDRAYNKDPKKFSHTSVFGKYLTKMKLGQFSNLRWSDTERLQKEYAEKLAEKPSKEQRFADLEEAYRNGKITAENVVEMKMQIEQAEQERKQYEERVRKLAVTGAEELEIPKIVVEDADSSLAAPEPVVLPNFSSLLLEEDKIYLATKWGKLYSAEDWIYLERKYNDFVETFDIQGAARVDTLIQICKLSLKANAALDCGDVESYSKLTRAYDALMKSAKFTEAQKREEKAQDFDSIGAIVAFAEKEGGIIPRRDLGIPLDIIDESIENLKRYNRELILNDPSLSRQLEDYLARREAVENGEKELNRALAEGKDYIEMTNDEIIEYNRRLAREKEKEAEEEDVTRTINENKSKT